MVRIAERQRTLQYSIEHWLDVIWRTGDNTQDVAACRLLLQRFLRLVEESHVFDGDDGLVGEGLQEVDLVLREQTWLRSGDIDRPDCHAILHHWHCESTSPASLPSHLFNVGRRCRVVLNIALI